MALSLMLLLKEDRPRHEIKRPNNNIANIETPLESIIPSSDNIYDYLNAVAA
jgi:hypothetical protein